MKIILNVILSLFSISSYVLAQTPDSTKNSLHAIAISSLNEELNTGLKASPVNNLNSADLKPSSRFSLPTVHLPANLDIHFVSPEPIQYADISDKNIIGDLPLKNVLRIRFKDSSKAEEAVVTIAGQKFLAQYRILPGGTDVPLQVNIEPLDTKPLDISGVELSQNQLRQLALDLYMQRPGKPKEKSNAFGLYGTVNHLYTTDDYIFIDLSFRNNTDLKFDIEGFRFQIDDKKIAKATNAQSVEVKPLFSLMDKQSFKKYYRNIFVLPKLTFPGNKQLHIELAEKQITGRIIQLNVSYQDILSADTIP